MDAPPSYDESTKATISAFPLSESSSSKKGHEVRRWHLQEELSASRAEHVTAAVNKVQAVLEDRVRVGISATTLVLVPYGQTVSSIHTGHELVGFPENEKPVIVSLHGEADTLDFWSQTQAIQELDLQLVESLGISPYRRSPKTTAEPALAPRSPVQRKSPYLTKRKHEDPMTETSKSLTVRLGEVYFRTETPFGLFETVALQAIVVKVLL